VPSIGQKREMVRLRTEREKEAKLKGESEIRRKNKQTKKNKDAAHPIGQKKIK